MVVFEIRGRKFLKKIREVFVTIRNDDVDIDFSASTNEISSAAQTLKARKGILEIRGGVSCCCGHIAPPLRRNVRVFKDFVNMKKGMEKSLNVAMKYKEELGIRN